MVALDPLKSVQKSNILYRLLYVGPNCIGWFYYHHWLDISTAGLRSSKEDELLT